MVRMSVPRWRRWVQGFGSRQMGLQQRRHAARKGCNAIFSAFPRANGELLHLEVDILDPKADSLHAAQAAAVQKLYNQWGVPTKREMTEATSSRVITTGTWAFLSARTALIGASMA